MNDLVKLIRQQLPADDPRSDSDLMVELVAAADAGRKDLLESYPEFGGQYRQLKAAGRPSIWREIKGSIGSAADNLQATTLGAGAMAADLVGADRLKLYLAEQAMEQQRQASEFTPSVGSYKDIEGMGDAGYFISYALGQVIPSAAESAILALVGAAIGTAVAPGPGSVGGAATGLIAKTALRNLMKAGVKDFVSEAGKAALAKEARSVAASMGAKVGLAAASIPQSQGEIYNSVGETEGGAGIAAAAGTLSGLLDLLPESYVLSRFFKPGKEIAKAEANKALAYVKRLGIEATKTMPMEGSTEAAQEFINWASEKYARNEPASITPADVERFTNAGLIGAVGGAMFAPVSAMGTGREMPAAPTQPTPPARPTRPVQPVPPVQPPFADSYGEPIGPVSPARASAEAMFAGETDEAGNPISPDRAMRRSDAGAAGLRADLFQQRTQADVAAAPALGEIEDTSGVVTPVDQFFAADANAKGPTEFDYIGKVRAAVQAAQNAERQAQENEAIRIRLEGMAARDNAANVRARQVGLAMMGAAPEPTEFDAMAQALGRTPQVTPQAIPQAPSALPSVQTAPVSSVEAAPAISQEPAPVPAGVGQEVSPEPVAAPAPTVVPADVPIQTTPTLTKPGQLAGLTLIRDLRSMAPAEREVAVKSVAGKNYTDSQGGVLILDRGTGKVQLRQVSAPKGKVMVAMAQRMEGNKGVQGRKGVIDFDAADDVQGAPLNKVLNEVLPDQTPRYEVVGVANFKSPKDATNVALGAIDVLDSNPEVSELVKLGAQAPTVTKGRDRTGTRPPKAKQISFDAVEGAISIDERSALTAAEGSAEAATALVDEEAAPAATPEFEVAGSFEQNTRTIMADAGIALAEGQTEPQVRKMISDYLTKIGVNDAVLKKRGAGINFAKAVDVVFARSQMLAEEADRLNTVRANSPVRLPETERIALFHRLVTAIRGSGGDVVAFQQNLQAALAPWAQANGFQLTQADGNSLIGIGLNTLNDRDPQNVIALLHETAHHFLEKLVTDPALKVRYQDALDRMAVGGKRWLMNPLSTDLRLIANADPATLSEYQQGLLAAIPAEQLAKLRATDPTTLLVEQAAEHLAMLGAEKQGARSLLSQIVRAVKSLLLSLGMAVQRTLKGPEAVSDRLVRQYVENRWLQFINRDFAQGPLAISSLRNWIGAPSTARERIAVYANIGGGDSRVGELDPATGEVYATDFVPEDALQLTDKLANANLTRRISRSIDNAIRYTPTTQVNSEFAIVNFLDETVTTIFQRLQAVLPKDVLELTDPAERKAAFLKGFLSMRESSQPEVMRAALRGEAQKLTDPLTNAKIPYSDTTTIASLVPTTETYKDVDGQLRSVELNSAQDYALAGSLARLYTIMGRVQNNLATATENFERLKKRKTLSEAEAERMTALGEKAALLDRVLNEPEAGLKWRVSELEQRVGGEIHDLYYPGAEYRVPGSVKSAPSEFTKRVIPKDLRFNAKLEQDFIANLASMRAWLDNFENTKHGKEYGRILNQWKRLSQEYSTTYTYSAVTGNMRKSFLGSLTEKFRDIGTPAAKQASKMIYRFQEAVSRYQNDSRIHGTRWSEAYQRLIRAMGRRNDESFKEQVWDVMSRTFEQINEGTQNASDIARRVLAKNYGIELKSNAEVSAFQDLVRATRDGQRWRKQVFEEMGLKVSDDALKGPDGKPLQRRLLAIGYFNGQRHASRLLSSLYMTMSPAWSSTTDADGKMQEHPLASLGDLLQEDPALANQLLAAAFPDLVIRDFVEPLVNNNSQFITLRDENGIVGPANQGNVQTAWLRAKGDVLAFAKELHRLEGRDDVDEAQTINDVMTSFLSLFREVKAEAEARNTAESNGMEVMPRQMMDGRQADNWPPEWTSYSRYDTTSNFVFVMQSALNHAFGRNGFGPGGEFATLVNAVRENLQQLRNTEANYRESGMSAKDIREKMGADEYAIALQAEDHLYMLAQMNDKMKAITKTTGYLLADFRILTDLIHLQAGAMLQQPRSAALQLFDLMAPLWKTKFSTVSAQAIKQAFTTVFADSATSLGAALGKDFSFNTDAAIRRRNSGIKDPDNYLSWKQKMDDTRTRFAEPDRPEAATERLGRVFAVGIRHARDIMNLGRNDVLPNDAPQALAPKFRPFGIFSAVSQSVTNGLVDALYTNFTDLAVRGVQLIERRGGAEAQERYVRDLESGRAKLDPKDLGYFRKWMLFNDKAAYDYMADAITTKMGERSVEDFVAKAYRRKQAGNGAQWQAIDDRQFFAISNIATSEYSLQANTVSTPIDMLTNPLLRSMSVFLIWPWNAMIRSAGSFRDAQGRLTKEAMIDGATIMLMGAIPAALAGSLLVDLYDEKVVGKRSNTRDLDVTSIIPGVGPILQPMASLERLARYGTFGLASEAVNGILNFDDARGGFSADNRIFIFNQFQTVRNVLGNLYQQEGEVTYQSVGRPLLQFLGMNGVLQYTQIANKQFGLSNVEAGINERINAGNYLRATGRALDLDVRVMKGAQSIPTPVTPYIQQMELGATTGNYELFREGYAHAIQQAARQGKEDPVKYVKEAFASRHPLRRIFRTLPTETEYRKILSSLNESGRSAVARTVTSYNSYLERLDLKPVNGAKEKGQYAAPTARPQVNMTLEQARALAAEASYGNTGGW